MKAGVAAVGNLWQQVRKNKLLSNASTYVFGSFIQRAAEFLLIPLWTRFLSPVDYGITGTMNAYAGVLTIVLLLSLNSAVLRHYFSYASEPQNQKKYVTSVLAFQLAFGFTLFLVLDLTGKWWWAALGGESIPFTPYVQLMLWIAYFRTWIQIPLSLYQASQKPKRFLLIQYLNFGVTFLITMALVVGYRMGAYGQMLASLTAAAVVGGVTILMVLRSYFTPHLSRAYMRDALLFALPLVPHNLAVWALNASDRIVLQHYVSLSDLGLYTLGYNLGMVMAVLVMAINQAWMPYYYKIMDTDPNPEQRIIRVVSVYIGLIGGICLTGAVFAGEIVHLLLPASYFGGIPYVAPVLLGYLFLGLYYFGSLPIFYAKKTTYIPLLTGSAAILNIVLNILLVPIYGAISSAWVTAFTYAFLLLPTYLISRRFQAIGYPLPRYLAALAAILALILLSSTLPIAQPLAILEKALLLAAGLFFLYRLQVAPNLREKLI